MFDNEMVKLEKKEFTSMQARLMAWGMHVGMVEFFSTRMTPAEIRGGANSILLAASLARVCDIIQNGTTIHYRSFPSKWTGTKAPPAIIP